MTLTPGPTPLGQLERVWAEGAAVLRPPGQRDMGRIAPGLRADLAVRDVTQPAELVYQIGFNPLRVRLFGGAG